MKILFGSTNPLKIKSLNQAFSEYYNDFEIISVDVTSGVPDMPVGDEIKTGVDNRIDNLKAYAKSHDMNVDFFIALEGGIFEYFDNWFMTNLAGIANSDSINYGMSGSFSIPLQYIEEVRSKTLGIVMDEVFGVENTRYTNGAVGVLTKNKIDRTSEGKEAFILALTKYIDSNRRFFSPKSESEKI